MKRIIAFVLIGIVFNTSLHAEFILNFYSGHVTVESGNKTIPLQIGMTLPEDSVIITGDDGFAAIFDSVRNIAVSIKPGTKSSVLPLYSLKNELERKPLFEKFKKEKPSWGETVASTRAMRVEPVKRFIPMYLRREWVLYMRKNYSSAAEATANNSDCEGYFIRGASLYYLYGVKSYDESVRKLEAAIAECNDPGEYEAAFFLPEAHRILANIYFELGRYDLSYKHLELLLKSFHEEPVSDVSYYIMILSCINTGREKEAEIYLQMFKREYPKSDLINGIRLR